ncbi:MAG: hypothetical protein SFU56_10160 [Capsulimonadales bacterium]|nr:hypothetical protein [Capsulimonadales bacterium]
MSDSNERPCPNCGTAVPAPATSCSHCGKALPPLPVLEGKTENVVEEPRRLTGTAWGDGVVGVFFAGITPFLVGLPGGITANLTNRFGNFTGEPATLVLLFTIPVCLGLYAALYFALRRRFPILGRTYGITALVFTILFPLGLLSNCLGILAGYAVTGGS